MLPVRRDAVQRLCRSRERRRRSRAGGDAVRSSAQTVSRAWTGRPEARRAPAVQERRAPAAPTRPEPLPAGPLDQVQRGLGGAAGGEHVVDDQDPLARREGVLAAPPGSPRRTPGRRRPRAPPGAACRPCARHHARRRSRTRPPRPARTRAPRCPPPRRTRRRSCATIASMTPRNASPSANSGIRSLNTMPGLGKSGTSRTCRRRAPRLAGPLSPWLRSLVTGTP